MVENCVTWFEGVTCVLGYIQGGVVRMVLINLNDMPVWDALKLLKNRGFSGFDVEKLRYLGNGKYAVVYTLERKELGDIEFYLYNGRFFSTYKGVLAYYKKEG